MCVFFFLCIITTGYFDFTSRTTSDSPQASGSCPSYWQPDQLCWSSHHYLPADHSGSSYLAAARRETAASQMLQRGECRISTWVWKSSAIPQKRIPRYTKLTLLFSLQTAVLGIKLNLQNELNLEEVSRTSHSYIWLRQTERGPIKTVFL